jgi:rubrerythrin
MFTMDDLLEIAVKMEKNGEATYLDSIEKIDHAPLKSMLEWMAAEEANHAKWFADKKEKLQLRIDETQLKEMVPDVLQGMIGDKALSLGDTDFSSLTTIDELFSTFIGFEKDTIVFYELLEMFIEDEQVVDGLKAIIEEEKKHITTLEAKIADFSDELIRH